MVPLASRWRNATVWYWDMNHKRRLCRMSISKSHSIPGVMTLAVTSYDEWLWFSLMPGWPINFWGFGEGYSRWKVFKPQFFLILCLFFSLYLMAELIQNGRFIQLELTLLFLMLPNINIRLERSLFNSMNYSMNMVQWYGDTALLPSMCIPFVCTIL